MSGSSTKQTMEADVVPWRDEPVLLTGATGFVGRALAPVLRDRGWEVICASRHPDQARRRHPEYEWVYLDVEEQESVERAVSGCGSAVYLIHQMRGGAGYEQREQKAANHFREACERAGVERIAYLGGVALAGSPSRHLASRLQTGRALRRGKMSTIELRASMIIGEGSESWQILHELAGRLPVMLLPEWTRSRSEPLHISDAVEALAGALQLPSAKAGWYGIPGPDAVSVKDLLVMTARRLGREPVTFDVPFLTPKLSGYWLRFVTECDSFVARQLVEGLKTDLLASGDEYWSMIGHREVKGIERAIEIATRETD